MCNGDKDNRIATRTRSTTPGAPLELISPRGDGALAFYALRIHCLRNSRANASSRRIRRDVLAFAKLGRAQEFAKASLGTLR